MSVIIQISKIQLRRGIQNELTVGSLAPGELAFTTDSGRLFIGSDPNQAGPVREMFEDRPIAPYDAIEVITEASVETFARVLDRLSRSLGPVGVAEGAETFLRRPFFESTLPVSANWAPVLVKRVEQATGLYSGGDDTELTLCEAESFGGLINYFLMDDIGVIRSGVMMVVHDGNPSVDEGRLIDEHVATPRIQGNGVPILVDDLFITGVQFRVRRVSSGGEYRMRLEFKNTTPVVYKMNLRVKVAVQNSNGAVRPTGGALDFSNAMNSSLIGLF